VKVAPVPEIVAVRALPAFAATEYVIVPLAVPFDPEVIVSHDALLVAVHGQPLGAVTVMDPVVADDVTLRDVGSYVTVQ
jgi:hypothetical protein